MSEVEVVSESSVASVPALPQELQALRATVRTYPESAYDLQDVLTQLGIGEAIVTVMNERGAPTPVAWTRLRAPESLMDPSTPETFAAVLAASPLQAKYGTAVDRESADETLTKKTADAEAQRASDSAAKEAEKSGDSSSGGDATLKLKRINVAERVCRLTGAGRYRDSVIRCGGHVIAGLARQRLLSILQERCRELGVALRFEVDITDLATLGEGHDLLIAPHHAWWRALVRR